MAPTHEFAERFLSRVPQSVRESFTSDQLAAVQLAFGMRYAMDHAVDVRRTLRLPWGRYYLVVLIGRDWRAGARRAVGTLMLMALATALSAFAVLVLG